MRVKPRYFQIESVENFAPKLQVRVKPRYIRGSNLDIAGYQT